MISPHRIKYRGVESTELNILDLIMCVAFDSDNGETSTFLNREAVVSETYDGRYKRVHRYKYNESFSPKFTFMKKDFGNFTIEEVRQVIKWLTSTDTTALLDVYYDDSNVVAWSAIGGWTEISTYKLANNRTVGIVATFEAVTPYAMSYLYTVPKTITNATDNKITIEIDTDDNKPVYPCITINHGYGTTPTPHLVVKLPDDTEPFNSIVDMADYVENTIYQIGSTYYYKAYTPTFTTSSALPEYVNWATVEVERPYTSADTFATNTFYHYDYEGMYYWKVGATFHEEPSRPVYGDWKTKAGTKAYTANDVFEEKTIYSYNGTYYWMAPHNFYKSSTPPNIQTTSVKIVNQHYDFFGQPDYRTEMIVKNNTSTEKIVVHGANRVISSDRTRRIFGDDFVDWQWLPLYDGKNEITVEGNCEVSFEYRCVRKVGEY